MAPPAPSPEPLAAAPLALHAWVNGTALAQPRYAGRMLDALAGLDDAPLERLWIAEPAAQPRDARPDALAWLAALGARTEHLGLGAILPAEARTAGERLLLVEDLVVLDRLAPGRMAVAIAESPDAPPVEEEVGRLAVGLTHGRAGEDAQLWPPPRPGALALWAAQRTPPATATCHGWIVWSPRRGAPSPRVPAPASPGETGPMPVLVAPPDGPLRPEAWARHARAAGASGLLVRLGEPRVPHGAALRSVAARLASETGGSPA